MFRPTLTYEVPAGWADAEDTPGGVLLIPPHGSTAGVDAGTSDYIGVYTSIAASSPDCRDAPAQGVGLSPTEIADWMTRQASLSTSKPRSVSVGGLNGVVLDVTIQENWTAAMACATLPDGRPVVPLIIGVGQTGLNHSMVPGLAIRLYLLSFGEGTLAIEVDDVSGGRHLAAYDALVEALDFAT